MKYSLRSLKFSIRNLLWLTVVVAVCTAWGLHVASINRRNSDAWEMLNRELKAQAEHMLEEMHRITKSSSTPDTVPDPSAPDPNPPKDSN